MKNDKKSAGAKGFTKEYWEQNYADPEEMDNIVNAKEHAAYIQAIFKLHDVEISSIIDLGFGYGVLFKEILKTFIPYRAHGIEPSKYIFDQVKSKFKEDWPSKSIKLVLENDDLVSWAKKTSGQKKTFDLGICTSVLQYLNDQEIKMIMPVMALQMRYLYLSVPTDLELKRQVEELDFCDKYAIHRTKEHYFELINPHFSFVSSRLLESKIYFHENTTCFSDLLFRF